MKTKFQGSLIYLTELQSCEGMHNSQRPATFMTFLVVHSGMKRSAQLYEYADSPIVPPHVHQLTETMQLLDCISSHSKAQEVVSICC